MSDDTLSGPDLLIRNALVLYPGMTDVFPADQIQIWDNEEEIFGDIENVSDLGNRLWIQPDNSPLHLAFSSSSAGHERAYVIGFGIGGMSLAKLRRGERLIQKAVASLFKGLKPDGTPFTSVEIAAILGPLILESVAVSSTDPNRQPLGTWQEWKDLMRVSLFCIEPHASLVAIGFSSIVPVSFDVDIDGSELAITFSGAVSAGAITAGNLVYGFAGGSWLYSGSFAGGTEVMFTHPTVAPVGPPLGTLNYWGNPQQFFDAATGKPLRPFTLPS